MNDINYIKPQGVQPIIDKFCMTIGILPTSYKLSLSYEEQILCIGKYLEETVYPAINNNAEAVAQLQLLFSQLKNYVENYFENLDVQEEINNKLEDMVESGELQEVISSYLNSNGILAFNNINSMKNATNLIDGSFAKTYGQLSYNDGKGNFYKIRTMLNTDVIDDDNIVALTNFPTLIAEKIPDYNITQLNTSVSSLDSRTTSLENTRNFELTGRTILIGDSYCAPKNGVDGWGTRLRTKLGLSNTNCYIFTSGGGFVAETTFLQLLQSNLENIQNPETIKNIVVVGGDNDNPYTYTQVQSAIRTFETYAKQHFPNAQIFIGYFMYSTTRNKFVHGFETIYPAYSNLEDTNIIYLNNVEYAVRDKRMLQADNVHLNDIGQKRLTQCLFNCLKNGSCTANELFELFTLTWSKPITATTGYDPGVMRNTESVTLFTNYLRHDFDTEQYSLDLGALEPEIDCGTWESNYYNAFQSYTSVLNCRITLHSSEGYLSEEGAIRFSNNGHFYVRFPKKYTSTHVVSVDAIILESASKEISSRME